MKIKSVLVAALLAGGGVLGASAASAMPLAQQKGGGLDAQQAHMVRICEHGHCFWARDHRHYRGDRWGYGGGRRSYSDDWRRHDRYDRERDWDQDWRHW